MQLLCAFVIQGEDERRIPSDSRINSTATRDAFYGLELRNETDNGWTGTNFSPPCLTAVQATRAIDKGRLSLCYRLIGLAARVGRGEADVTELGMVTRHRLSHGANAWPYDTS